MDGRTSIRAPETIRTHGERFIGSMLRLLRTRYDLPCAASSIAAMLAGATQDADVLSKMIASSGKARKAAREAPSVLSHMPLFLKGERRIRPIQIAPFGGASYRSLPNEGSLESGFITLPRLIARNGTVKCIGHVLHFYPHRISRVVRSSKAAECAAISNVIDYTIWFRSLVVEVYTSRFALAYLNEFDPLPLITPFRNNDEDVKVNYLLAPNPKRQTIIHCTKSKEMYLGSNCATLQEESTIPIAQIRQGVNNCYKVSREPNLHCLILTDCSNCCQQLTAWVPNARARQQNCICAT